MTPEYGVAIADIVNGTRNWDMWGRLGWREVKRRYRRTVVGPFWTTLSLAIFVAVLGIVWSRLWNQDPKVYLPYLTSGMLTWVMFSSFCTEGSATFFAAEGLIKQLRVSYTLLAISVVWRNLIVFVHNLAIYVLICFYAGVPASWALLLIVPGLAVICLNGVWIVLFLGMACARFRDLQQLVTSILQVSMFITPIFWAPDQLKGRAAVLVDYNPLFHIVDIVRAPLLGKAPATWTWVVVAAMTVVGWGGTLYFFSRFRRRIPYWL
jgi:ABC-type polysaccharide/polyol phosphate export permease